MGGIGAAVVSGGIGRHWSPPGVMPEDSAGLKRLKRENTGFRRGERDLESGLSLHRSRGRPARETAIRFIAEHNDHCEPGIDGGAGLR